MSHGELNCDELVEIVTEYLEGGLSALNRNRFEMHVQDCVGCANYLDQIQVTIAVTGRITPDDLSGEAKAELLAAFRGWK